MARATGTPCQLRTKLDVPFEEADRRVRDALAEEVRERVERALRSLSGAGA